jgi:hypothetical protein
MDTRLVPLTPTTWTIESGGRRLGELRKIGSLYVLIPSAGSPLDDVKGGYGSQAAAMNAIVECTQGSCKMAGVE